MEEVEIAAAGGTAAHLDDGLSSLRRWRRYVAQLEPTGFDAEGDNHREVSATRNGAPLRGRRVMAGTGRPDRPDR